MNKYPDISHWHPVVDWNQVKANCPFLISKATQGTKYVDPTLDSFISGCEEHRIPYWLFVYLNKGNEVEQVDFLIRTCINKVGKYFVGYVLDVEAENKEADVNAALEYLTAHGAKTMLYTMYAQYSWYKDVIAQRPETCAWWEARYGSNMGIYSPKYPPHEGVDLHQFTSQGSCPGISGNCDLNRVLQKGEKWYTTPLEANEQETGVIYTLSIADVWTREQAEEVQQQLSSIGINGVIHKVKILD